MHTMLAVTIEGRWQAGIGDPTVMGWVTVVAYFLAAAFCAIFAYRARQARIPRWRTHLAFWGGLALVMVLLGINKQLDLQTLFTQIGRDVARQQGWYDQRRLYQREFIYGLVFGGVTILITSMLLLIGTWRRTGLALVGLVFLLVFIILRASSFHHVDRLLGDRMVGLKVNWLFELGGIGCIALAAAWNLVRSDPRQIGSLAGGRHCDAD